MENGKPGSGNHFERRDYPSERTFSWNASLLYAFNRNKVKHISVQPSLWDSRISMPTSYPMVGKPLYGIYAYK